MDLQHINAKIHVEGELPVDPERFIDIFHAWIRDEALPEMLIDVADYRHVPNGPGVMLIAHEADYALDQREGQWGLLYNRKAEADGSNSERLNQALSAAAGACQLLETHFADSGLKFSRTNFELLINDRLRAPNTAETYEKLQPEVEAFLGSALGNTSFKLQRHDSDPRRRAGFTVNCQHPFELQSLNA